MAGLSVWGNAFVCIMNRSAAQILFSNAGFFMCHTAVKLKMQRIFQNILYIPNPTLAYRPAFCATRA